MNSNDGYIVGFLDGEAEGNRRLDKVRKEYRDLDAKVELMRQYLNDPVVSSFYLVQTVKMHFDDIFGGDDG